jgi:hypothetical protein
MGQAAKPRHFRRERGFARTGRPGENDQHVGIVLWQDAEKANFSRR